MRNLVLLRGSAGCGKSTWLKENGLEQYVISPDEIRLLHQSPVMQLDGTYTISQRNDKAVWNLVFTLLERRMERGEFTIIDATHARAKFLAQYKHLLDRYRYRGFVVNFKMDVEEVLRRNKNREGHYKFVPEKAIRDMCAKLETQPTPNYMKEIKPEEFKEFFQYKKLDVSGYDKIHFIGDIHGCFEPLREYFNQYHCTLSNLFGEDGILLPTNELFVFIGDYFDRGIQNAEVFKFMLEVSTLDNVILLEGNHEFHLKDWAFDGIVKSKEFQFQTIPEFEKAGITREDARKFVRKLGQIAYLQYHEKEILVTHGGIPVIPDNLLFVDTETLVKGVGGYKDDIDQIFIDCATHDRYMIHGHRNLMNKPVLNLADDFWNRGSTNLEGKVEFGENLRIATLDKEGWKAIEIKNNTYRIGIVSSYKGEELDTVSKPIGNTVTVETLRKSKFVRENKLANDVSSFNFTRDAFLDKQWNSETVKARGLFIDTLTGDIVARSYDKFFNVGGANARLEDIEKKMKFPATVYLKYNGFLGLVGYHKRMDDLFICSKSTNDGYHVDLLTDEIVKHGNQELIDYVRKNNVTLIFEVIHQEKDPHIISYEEPTFAVLLDIVENTWEGKRKSYEEVGRIAHKFGFVPKVVCHHLSNFNALTNLYKMVSEYDYRLWGCRIEGYVIEDPEGYMVKLKTEYYFMWKSLRPIIARVAKRADVDTRRINGELQNYFYSWLLNQDLTMFSLNGKNEYSVLKLRDKFFKDVPNMRRYI